MGQIEGCHGGGGGHRLHASIPAISVLMGLDWQGRARTRDYKMLWIKVNCMNGWGWLIKVVSSRITEPLN